MPIVPSRAVRHGRSRCEQSAFISSRRLRGAIAHPLAPGQVVNCRMVATNKCLAKSNKSPDGGKATNKRGALPAALRTPAYPKQCRLGTTPCISITAASPFRPPAPRLLLPSTSSSEPSLSFRPPRWIFDRHQRGQRVSRLRYTLQRCSSRRCCCSRSNRCLPRWCCRGSAVPRPSGRSRWCSSRRRCCSATPTRICSAARCRRHPRRSSILVSWQLPRPRCRSASLKASRLRRRGGSSSGCWRCLPHRSVCRSSRSPRAHPCCKTGSQRAVIRTRQTPTFSMRRPISGRS